MKNNNLQHVYLYMDDSGKISKYETYAIFAGIVFHNTKENSKFTNMYRSVVKQIKCQYCIYSNACNASCPEIKAFNIKQSHRRRLINLSKSHTTFATTIYNKNLLAHIITDTSSKGRFNEYAQRRIIKETIKTLISQKIINPNIPIHLHLNIDEMPTKSNGYYSLKDGLLEELKYGITNFNYGTLHKPILHNHVCIQVIYKDSKKDYGVQMADILANTVRHSFVINNNWYDTSNYLTTKLKINVLLRLP